MEDQFQKIFEEIKAEEANEVFEMLMGDHVGPRRQFIEDNATFVNNLDV